MRITSKGQVTIPQAIRDRLGLFPHAEVEFGLADDDAIIRKVSSVPVSGERGRRAIAALRGTADSDMSTDEIMALTRGEIEV